MAAPKGNKYALGNNGGCPPAFKTPQELQEKIQQYFNEGVKKRTVLLGKAPNQTSIELEVPTITGLSYFLGFESRQSFYDYEKRNEFSYIVKRARLFIETEYEECLQYGNTTGAIFALKNMGWTDKIESNVNNMNYEMNDLTDAEIKRINKVFDDTY